MKVRWFYTLLAVLSITGVLIAGLVAHSEASAALAGAAQNGAGASTFSVPF